MLWKSRSRKIERWIIVRKRIPGRKPFCNPAGHAEFPLDFLSENSYTIAEKLWSSGEFAHPRTSSGLLAEQKKQSIKGSSTHAQEKPLNMSET